MSAADSVNTELARKINKFRDEQQIDQNPSEIRYDGNNT